MKNILFPTDFSNHAPEIFKYAVEIAFAFKANLIIMHAYGKPGFEYSAVELREVKSKAVQNEISDFVSKNFPPKYNEYIQVNYSTIIESPARAILDTVQDKNIDLIVMGMTGKTNARDTLMGNTALEVLTKADCPVLAIPATSIFKSIDRLVYNTNFEFKDLGAINYLRDWAKKLTAAIYSVHISDHKENKLQVMNNINILKNTYQEEKLISFESVEGDYKKEIINFVRQKEADILVMLSHKRNFISRLLDRDEVKSVAREISIPLLIIKDNAYELNTDAEDLLQLLNSIG
ncbi:MAG: nucleotide-binding universal stress UspA family protein [Saprospiraceae bacterium]|jgi:nucleotide-binding universal stress UspA family protein